MEIHTYYIGQKVCSRFYIASYRKFQTSFLGNPTYAFFFFFLSTHTHQYHIQINVQPISIFHWTSVSQPAQVNVGSGETAPSVYELRPSSRRPVLEATCRLPAFWRPIQAMVNVHSVWHLSPDCMLAILPHFQRQIYFIL